MPSSMRSDCLSRCLRLIIEFVPPADGFVPRPMTYGRLTPMFRIICRHLIVRC